MVIGIMPTQEVKHTCTADFKLIAETAVLRYPRHSFMEILCPGKVGRQSASRCKISPNQRPSDFG